MHEYDDAVLQCFLKNQGQLFPEAVASSAEEAQEFLTDCMAVVVRTAGEVQDYFDEAGLDTVGEAVLDASEVFEIGDGRFLIVEG